MIIDEQHRFGECHPAFGRLAAKATSPPFCWCSRPLPIPPHTLALALAGHLEISDLPERPNGPHKVDTMVLEFEHRKAAVDELAAVLGGGVSRPM